MLITYMLNIYLWQHSFAECERFPSWADLFRCFVARDTILLLTVLFSLWENHCAKIWTFPCTTLSTFTGGTWNHHVPMGSFVARYMEISLFLLDSFVSRYMEISKFLLISFVSRYIKLFHDPFKQLLGRNMETPMFLL